LLLALKKPRKGAVRLNRALTMKAPNGCERLSSFRPNGPAMLLICRTCGQTFQSRSADRRCAQCGGVLTTVRRRARFTPFLAVALTIVGGMATIGARDKIVPLAPITARAYEAIGLPVNLRGLAFNDVRTNLIDAEGRRVLTIEGAVVNLRGQKNEVPDMRIAVRDADGHEIYAWTTRPPKPALEAREETAFRLRLASPPPGAREVMVRFASTSEKSAPAEGKL
jgi:hypothetical protein